MPDVFPYFIEETGTDPPTIFLEEEFGSNFLLNAGAFMLIFAINYLLLGIFILLSLWFPKVSKFQSMKVNLGSGFPMRIAVEAVLELVLACVLQLRNYMDYSMSNIVGIGTAILIIAAYI